MAGRGRGWVWRALSSTIGCGAMLGLGLTAATGWFWAKRVEPRLALQPTGEALRDILTSPHALLYRVRDTVEYECHCPQPVRFQDLSPAFIKVLVGTEDREFWSHSGIDWRAILRAAFVNLTSGQVRSGASTLTQQLVKMKLLSPEQSRERKVLEALLARRVSDVLTKEEVLAAYANAAWFAPGVTGVEAASRHFFRKLAKDLNLWEAALLVGMLRAPSRYNPDTYTKAAADLATKVLGALVEAGLLARQDMERAIRTSVQSGSQSPLDSDFRWYLDAVRAELRRLNRDLGPRERLLRVSLFLDVPQQQVAQAIVHDAAPHYRSAIVSTELDGRTRAIVGGHDYGERQWNLALHEKRQAASLAKIPAAAVALRNGFSPESMLLDAPLHGSWPRNGPRRHTGAPVSLRYAFAHSLNAPFAQLIAREIEGGVGRMQGLTKVCSPDLEIPRVESIVTGAFDLTPWEAAGLTASFVTGRCVQMRTVRAITSAWGELLYQASAPTGRALLPSRTVATLSSLMREAVERGTGNAAAIPGHNVRGKTGTSEDNQHGWFVGYTPEGPLSVHWLGVGAETRLREVSGADAAQQFKSFQRAVLGPRGVVPPPLPPARPKAPAPRSRPNESTVGPVGGATAYNG